MSQISTLKSVNITKELYSKLLARKEWLIVRNLVLIRDKYKCLKCNSRNKLEVHHILYIENKMPWEIPTRYLITLCEECHKKEHRNRPISDFIVKSIKDTNKKGVEEPIKVKKSPKRAKKSSVDKIRQAQWKKIWETRY